MDSAGILTALVTPFDGSGEIDEETLVRLMHRLRSEGSDGFVIAGTTGEGSTLTDDEKLRLWSLAVEEAGDATVIANTGSNDTAHSVHLTERATEIGVDGVLVVTPYYNKPNRRGIVAHFEACARATDLPLIVYNIPSRCVVDIPNDLLEELAQIDGIEAVKQARDADLEPIDGMDLLAGNDDMLARVLDLGGSGGICVASHLVGAEMRRMIDQPDRRDEIDAALGDVFDMLGLTTNPIPVKAALDIMGRPVGGLRLPMVEASEDERSQIRSVLDRHGLTAEHATSGAAWQQ
ncbi:MAG: 4-hydroxy-tetrahydrodipicolinate synthase [Thermoleophilaceae bacterium]